MAGPRAEELRSLEHAPRSAALVVAVSGATLVLVAWVCGAASGWGLASAALVAATVAAWVLARGWSERARVETSVDSVGARLAAWADGTEAARVDEHPLTSDLVGACAELVERLERAERESAHHRALAQDADRERLAFLADFSHELRTPLNSILGFAHILESGAEGPLSADGIEAIGIISASGEQLRTLIEDVLDLSALETGALELAPRPVDLGELALAVTRTAQVVADQKHLTLTVSTDPGVLVLGDDKRIRRILWNLLARCIRATDVGDVAVEVRASSTLGSASGSVVLRDAGKPLTSLESVALVEGTLDEATSREGVGIGLAVAGKLVRRLEGRIELESLSPGTRIELALPLASREDVAWAEENRASMLSPPGSGKRSSS